MRGIENDERGDAGGGDSGSSVEESAVVKGARAVGVTRRILARSRLLGSIEEKGGCGGTSAVESFGAEDSDSASAVKRGSRRFD